MEEVVRGSLRWWWLFVVNHHDNDDDDSDLDFNDDAGDVAPSIFPPCPGWRRLSEAVWGDDDYKYKYNNGYDGNLFMHENADDGDDVPSTFDWLRWEISWRK